jgi:hypothetical protein
MGNWVKNRLLKSGSTSVVVPSGSTSTRPDAPTFGQFRFNTDTGLLEFFNGVIFQSVAATGPLTYVVDAFVGDGSTTVFTMTKEPADAEQVLVFVGSIYQTPGNAYTVNGGFDLTFTSPPPDGEPISIIHTEV